MKRVIDMSTGALRKLNLDSLTFDQIIDLMHTPINKLYNMHPTINWFEILKNVEEMMEYSHAYWDDKELSDDGFYKRGIVFNGQKLTTHTCNVYDEKLVYVNGSYWG